MLVVNVCSLLLVQNSFTCQFGIIRSFCFKVIIFWILFTPLVLASSYLRTVLHLAKVHSNTHICTRNENMVHINVSAKMIY